MPRYEHLEKFPIIKFPIMLFGVFRDYRPTATDLLTYYGWLLGLPLVDADTDTDTQIMPVKTSYPHLNWASCDVFCSKTVGAFLEMYPKYVTKLMKWAKSPNMWVRRSAAVSLVIPARKKLFHKEVFEIATVLLHDGEDLVQKGYGWMLKVASESDQDAVFRFVLANKATMPRTALRYAIEKMPQHLKKQAMATD